jgi:hypothetical protein
MLWNGCGWWCMVSRELNMYLRFGGICDSQLAM